MKYLKSFILPEEGLAPITVYHGTSIERLESIEKNGLRCRSGYVQGWYMVASDMASALFHAMPQNGEDAIVIEFTIPDNGEKWEGYPYLWLGNERTPTSTWYALRQEVPTEYITKVHRISHEQWLQQKSDKF